MKIVFSKEDIEAEYIDPELPHIKSYFTINERVEFFVERKRTGYWDGRFIREDSNGLPWGILGILFSTDGYIRLDKRIN
jgi:hypothetical protein